jgi:hypothetical protein
MYCKFLEPYYSTSIIVFVVKLPLYAKAVPVLDLNPSNTRANSIFKNPSF